ncbi:MAG: hypothetical protein ACRD82_03220 [Blastocatellia bacterium]
MYSRHAAQEEYKKEYHINYESVIKGLEARTVIEKNRIETNRYVLTTLVAIIALLVAMAKLQSGVAP